MLKFQEVTDGNERIILVNAHMSFFSKKLVRAGVYVAVHTHMQSIENKLRVINGTGIKCQLTSAISQWTWMQQFSKKNF